MSDAPEIDDESFDSLDIDQELLKRAGTGNSKAEQDRREKLLPYIVDDYVNGGEIPETLSEKYDIPKSTLYDMLKNAGIAPAKDKRAQQQINKEIRKAEQEELSLEADKIATIAIAIGGSIARRYLPLIDSLVSVQGMSLEEIARDVMEWYERRTAVNAQMEELRAQAFNLQRSLQDIQILTNPNFRYHLRAKLTQRYYMQLLQARFMGLKLPVKPIVQAYYNDLLAVEGDLDVIGD